MNVRISNLNICILVALFFKMSIRRIHLFRPFQPFLGFQYGLKIWIIRRRQSEYFLIIFETNIGGLVSNIH